MSGKRYEVIAMEERKVTIDLDGGTSITALLETPVIKRADGSTGVIIAHGAGNDMHHPLIVEVARQASERGYPALRFNFPYRERGASSPDNLDILMAAWRGAYDCLAAKSGYNVDHVIACGKSMGGRVAAKMTADGLLPAAALVFLGYPLHAPGSKEKLRHGPLHKITRPMFFVAGTRDPFCDYSLFIDILNQIKAPWTLKTVDGGDHSFHVPKARGLSDEVIYRSIGDAVGRWISDLSKT